MACDLHENESACIRLGMGVDRKDLCGANPGGVLLSPEGLTFEIARLKNLLKKQIFAITFSLVEDHLSA